MRVLYRHEYPRRIRAGFIGAGGHSYRNVYPAFAYAPVDLVAVCDRVEERAQNAARQFGAPRIYTDHRQMLEREELEAVFIVVGYDPTTGRPLYPSLAMDAMRAGCDAWIEKPPAATVAEIEAMQAVEQETERFTMVGLKKCFAPAVEKVKEILSRPEFGGVQSATLRYPQYIPTVEEMRQGPAHPRTRSFLDHIVHPASLMHFLMGMPVAFTYSRSSTGSGIALYAFASGATAALHLAAGQSPLGAHERVEVVGRGHHVVNENQCRVTYYRPGRRGTDGGYGRESHYTSADECAPLVWEPEFSLGQLYNSGLFLLGYWGEIHHFAECVLERRRPERAGLEAARDVLRLYEAFANPPGVWVSL